MGLGLVADLGQGAALDGLHDHHRHAVLLGHLIAEAGLDRGVLPVEVVDLQLDKVQARLGGEDLVQEGGAVMEGEAHLLDDALGLFLAQPGKAVELLDGGPGAGVDVVQQVVVEVIHPAVFQLLLEDAVPVLKGLEGGKRQLGGQGEAVPGVPGHQRLADGLLAGAAVVDIGGIEVGEALLEEAVHHRFKLGHIDAGDIARIGEGQTHTAKTEFFHREVLLFSVDACWPSPSIVAEKGESCKGLSACGRAFWSDRWARRTY